MSETEQEPGNSYVATAAAEKRLREVLEAEFGGVADVGYLADALLSNAKIEYKPRLKAVLITLPIPDTATRTKVAEPVTEQRECPFEGCMTLVPHYHRETPDGSEVVRTAGLTAGDVGLNAPDVADKIEQNVTHADGCPGGHEGGCDRRPGFLPFQPKPIPAGGYVDSDV